MKRPMFHGCIVVLALYSLCACNEQPTAETDAFVTEYVQSVYEGSDFFRQYTADDEEDIAERGRSLMTKDFEVRYRDTLMSMHEYMIVFSNGNRGHVQVVARKGKVTSANMSVHEKD